MGQSCTRFTHVTLKRDRRSETEKDGRKSFHRNTLLRVSRRGKDERRRIEKTEKIERRKIIAGSGSRFGGKEFFAYWLYSLQYF